MQGKTAVRTLNRTPPADVRRELRTEVGFACPVTDCGSPYLTWHHFDPPWAEKQHHDPTGMIALCRVHADQADSGAFAPEQIRELKATGRERAEAQAGRFNWMRHELLAVIGGTLAYEVHVPLRIHGRNTIWFNRDASGRFLLNANMPATTPSARIVIADNSWLQLGEPSDLQCPPSGRLVYVKYPNGDLLRVEFLEIESADALVKRHRYAEHASARLEAEVPGLFPVTVVEVRLRVMAPDGSAPILDFDSQKTRIGGATFQGTLIRGGEVGFSIG